MAEAGDVLRGIEVLLKKAAVDARFKTLLLERRADAAATIGLDLGSTEAAMLKAVPREQLEATIARTRVDSRLRPVLLGKTAQPMIEVLSATSRPYEIPSGIVGITVGPTETAVRLGIIGGAIAAVTVPFVLLLRKLRRRRRNREAGVDPKERRHDRR